MNSENYNVLVIGEIGSGKVIPLHENPRTGKSIIHIENSIELLCQSPLNLNSVNILKFHTFSEIAKFIKNK